MEDRVAESLRVYRALLKQKHGRNQAAGYIDLLGGGTGEVTMVIKTVPFNAAEYLGSQRAQIELLTDALDSEDAGYVANALGVIARTRGMSAVAQGAGVSREALYKALTPHGDPKLSTAMGVLRTLGFKLVPRRRAKVDA